MSLDLWATDVGVDYGSMFKVFGGLLQGGGQMLEEKQAGDKASAESASTLEKAKAADIAAAAAMVSADLSEQAKSKTFAADVAKAKKAIAEAGALPNSPERTAAADEVLARVKKNLAAKPKDLVAQANVKAWTAITKQLHTPMGAAQGTTDQEPWLTRRVLGPIPGYGVVVGSVGFAGAVGLVIWKIVAARKK